MVGYLLIIVYTLLNIGESVVVRNYAKRHGSGGFLMNAITALFAALFFLVTDKGGFYAPAGMLPLAAINVCLFGAGFYFMYVAFQCGPYGLTRLISGFSLLFTIFYGIIVLKEKTTALTYVGIVMIFAAMIFINYKKSTPTEKENQPLSLKWFVSVMLTLVSNGFIGILTRMQQIRFDNACSNEFQFISIGGSFVLLAIIGVIVDRNKLGKVLKTGTLYGAAAGIFNGAKNFLTLIIYLYLPLSVVSPTKTGLSIIATFVMALLVYKEKYTVLQYIGVALGGSAVILLAL
jgi:drug/metabolite transporter (DMT)-like permease